MTEPQEDEQTIEKMRRDVTLMSNGMEEARAAGGESCRVMGGGGCKGTEIQERTRENMVKVNKSNPNVTSSPDMGFICLSLHREPPLSSSSIHNTGVILL